MISDKTWRFLSRNFKSNPTAFPGMLRRRFVEAVSTAPNGRAKVSFGGVTQDFDLSLHRLAQKYYFKTHEMFLERVFQKYLAPGMTFIDVGANCGYWSAFALNITGKTGAVHAFEPVPVLFEILSALKANNPSHQVVLNNAALGAAAGELEMAVVPPRPDNYENFDTNIGSGSLLPGYLNHDKHLTQTIKVPVLTFDDYIAKAGIDLDRVGLIKIDVEGYESYVIDGMSELLSRKGRKVAILCELLTDTKRHELLNGPEVIRRVERFGYRTLDATTLKPVRVDEMGFEENVVFVGR